MIIINVKKVLAAEKQREAAPKPLPRVAFKSQVKPQDIAARQGATPTAPRVKPQDFAAILTELEIEYSKILKERKILSTHTQRIVAEVSGRLAMESPGMVQEFLDGRLGMPELREHYAKIQDKSDLLLDLFDKMEHVKRYGTMPVHTPPTVSIVKVMDSPEAAQLRYEIRRLDDYIYKRVKYLEKCKGGLKQPRNTDTVNNKKMEIALAQARRDDCKSKLKRIQYEQRT